MARKELKDSAGVVFYPYTDLESVINSNGNETLSDILSNKQDNLTFDTTPVVSSINPITSGGVKAAISVLADGIYYDSNSKRIYLRNGDNNISGSFAYIDATDFIKDGMVDTVNIDTPTSGSNSGVLCLIITFNTI